MVDSLVLADTLEDILVPVDRAVPEGIPVLDSLGPVDILVLGRAGQEDIPVHSTEVVPGIVRCMETEAGPVTINSLISSHMRGSKMKYAFLSSKMCNV